MKILIFLALLSTQYLFALISIAPMEIGEKAGFHGNVGLSFETKRGNTDKDNYKASTKISYDNNVSYVAWAEISGEYGEANGVEDTNKVYAHARYISAITDESIRYELFAQTEENRFKLIQNRRLGGIGLRFEIFEIFKGGRGYLGAGTFYEYVNYTSADPEESNVRLNTYFAYTAKLGGDSSITYTLFYQPKVEEFTDSTTAQKLEFQLHIYKQLFLNFQVAYDADTQPAIGVEEYDFTQTTSFVYKF